MPFRVNVMDLIIMIASPFLSTQELNLDLKGT